MHLLEFTLEAALYGKYLPIPSFGVFIHFLDRSVTTAELTEQKKAHLYLGWDKGIIFRI